MQRDRLAGQRLAAGRVRRTEMERRGSGRPGETAARLGWLPALALVGSAGLLLVGVAMARATVALPGAEALFWAGLLVLYLPAVWRLAGSEASRNERIALIVWLGLALYMVKVLRAPTGFVFHDEFPHWRTASDIVETHHLFHPNTLQAVSALYPGLEVATAAIVNLTGLSISQAGTLLVGVARLVAVLAVYLLYEQVSDSPRVAGIGTAVYMAYPNFVFWSSQYAYESLALPVALLMLFLATRSSTGRLDALVGPRSLVVLTLASVVVIHHLTSYVLTALLFLLMVFTARHALVVRQLDRVFARIPLSLQRRIPGGETKPIDGGTVTGDSSTWRVLWILALIGSLTWLAFVAQETIGYLAPHFRSAVAAVTGLIFGEQTAKPLFRAPTPVFVTPAWERIVSLASVLLTMLGIPFGLIQVWRRHRTNGMALVFAVAALAYPVTLVVRLTSSGSEISNRALDFLFVALGFVLALGAAELYLYQYAGRLRYAVFAAVATIVFAGGVALGLPYWARLPGPYAVGGDTRAIQPESLDLADWAAHGLGPGHNITADQTNALLMGSYGQQNIIGGLSWVYFSPTFQRDAEYADLLRHNVNYLVVDHRLSWMLPKTAFYFEEQEPRAGVRTAPIDIKLLTKFDQVSYLSRVFDSGDIVVYGTGIGAAAG